MLTRRGQARRRRITTTTRKRIAPLPQPLPPLCCYRCRPHMLPHQLCHYCLCSSSGSSGSSSSGLRRCAVAAAADSRMPWLTPVFLFFLLNVCYTWHRIHHVEGPSLRNSGSGILDPKFRSKLIFPWNHLIPTCVPRNSKNSTDYPEFRNMWTGRNQNSGWNAQPSPWEALCVDLISPYTLKGKDGSSVDFMTLTMIDPTSSWLQVMELPTIT